MPINRMVSSPEPLPAASGMLLQPSRAATVCEVDRARKRAASCNRLGPRIPKQHWEFDTCPNEYALDPKLPNLRVLRHVLHLSSTEAPSLHQSYPVSAVLRTSPPPQSARPVPHGRPVGPVIPDLATLGASRVACAFLVYVLPPLPRCSGWASSSLIYPAVPAFPDNVVGSACTSSFSRPAQRSLALRPAHSSGHLYVTSYTEGFSHFVTSMTAPVASGWSGCRVGLAPTGKRRLGTAHTLRRRCMTRAIAIVKSAAPAVTKR